MNRNASQRAAEDPRRAAALALAAVGQPQSGPAAADDPFALPALAVARPAAGDRARSCCGASASGSLTIGGRRARRRWPDGSIGRALELVDAGGLALYRSLVGMLSRVPRLDRRRCTISPTSSPARTRTDAYRAAGELLSELLARTAAGAARGGGVGPDGPAAASEDEAMRRLAAGADSARWAELREDIDAQLRRRTNAQSRPPAERARRVLCDRRGGTLKPWRRTPAGPQSSPARMGWRS